VNVKTLNDSSELKEGKQEERVEQTDLKVSERRGSEDGGGC
jgi:hypothetical protein